MKPMKFLITGILLCVLGTGLAIAAPNDNRGKARHVYSRTAAVIRVAQRFAASSHVNYGLGLAITHHRYSEKLFRQDQNDEAIFHSLRARNLAASVIKQNKSEILQEALYDQTEASYAQRSPSDDDLDRRIRGEKLLSDRAAENTEFGSDL